MRQAVSLSVEHVPPEYFLQTICRLNWANVPSDRFSQTVCQRFRDLAPLEKIFTDKLWKPFNYYFKYVQSVFKMKENDWDLLQHCFLWLIFPFMVIPLKVKKVLKNSGYIILAIFSVAMLQSSCIYLYVYFWKFC